MEDDNPTGPSYGRVAYTHGLGIDAPLGVVRMGYTSGNVGEFASQDMKDWVAAGVIAFVPHANWRGVYDGGTAMDGRRLPCETSATCTFVDWPERNYRAFHNQGNPRQALIWFGGLVDKMRDGSGYLYMRNRYYNPQTGTFTQEDPIGLAGGLNVYGFADGDPVSYSDPYGLCKRDRKGNEDPECRRVINALRSAAANANVGRGERNLFNPDPASRGANRLNSPGAPPS